MIWLKNKPLKYLVDNLQKLLLQPPLKGKVVLGVDPAFRTGCKLSVCNEQGTAFMSIKWTR